MGEKRIYLDAETTGLQWWNGDRPVGWSYTLPESGRKGYLPFGHQGGGNLDEAAVKEWMRRELRGVHIDNINTKFDLHVAREWGVDLTEQDNTFGDVAHRAALLDDHRMRFNLEQLAQDLLGYDLGKVDLGLRDKGSLANLPAWEVEAYAVQDTGLIGELIDHTDPLIAEEDLGKVLHLEEEVLPAVVEMEKNGCQIDVELLHKWKGEVDQKIPDLLYSIWKKTGVRLNSFDSSKDIARLFDRLDIPVTSYTEAGNPSFTDGVLKDIDHPVIKDLRLGGQLADLKSKYLDKYAAAVRSDGWLRFNLHQLRIGKSEEDKKGTVSGRFSGAGDKFGGFNPQQVVAVEKQLERGWCPDYVIRRLFLSNFAADMMQVEYRLFAHYAHMHGAFHAEPKQKMIGGKMVWIAGPLADFHALVAELLLPINPNLNRKLVKNINFAMIYGAGLLKFAFMLGLISEQEFNRLSQLLAAAGRDWKKRASILDSSEGVGSAKEIRETYLGMFPAVQPLLKQASELAENRGYVRTLEGRRARLHGRFHSALNRVIQGGAADINKRVVAEVYKQRKRLGLMMRVTVHDELVGNLADPGMLPEVEKVLNHQYYDLRAPILWDAKMGNNWAECK